jgi:uncharacterized protein (TIGR00730 family)
MVELEWQHLGLSELAIVTDLRKRKEQMLERADAVVALPGGSGTLEELLEAITMKRLGLFVGPIVIVNTAGFFEPLIRQLDSCVDEAFMAPRHQEMWQVVREPTDVPDAFRRAREWSAEALRFANL